MVFLSLNSQSLSSLDMIEEYLAYEDRLAQEGKLDENCGSAIWGWTRSEDYFRYTLYLKIVMQFGINVFYDLCNITCVF